MAKFEAGEVVEVRSSSGLYEGWREYTIREIHRGVTRGGFFWYKDDGDELGYLFFGGWGSTEPYMRKKKPPEQELSKYSFKELMDNLKQGQGVEA